MRPIAVLLAFAIAAAPAHPQAPVQPAYPGWNVTAQDLSILPGDRLLAKAGLPGRMAELRAAADQPDMRAMSLLAIAHLNGIGVPRDPVRARGFALRAAAVDEPRSLYTLGAIHANGAGVRVDLRQAADYFARAREAGIMLAAADLGTLLYNGEGGVARDRARAFILMRDAGAAGVGRAYGGVALAYFHGEGIAQDYVAAREAAWRGVEHREPLSQLVLAMLYGGGLGVEADSDRAQGWLQTAALDGSPEAQRRLGWTDETLAQVRRWGPYARLANRRLSRGPHIFHYRWEEPGRVLVLDYANLEDRGEIDVVYTWPEGAPAPTSDHPEWAMRVIDGQLYERAPMGMFLQFNADQPQVTLTEYEAGADGRPGSLRRVDPLPTLPRAQYEEMRDRALARPTPPAAR